MVAEVHCRQEVNKGRAIKLTWSATVAATCALLAALMSVGSCATGSGAASFELARDCDFCALAQEP